MAQGNPNPSVATRFKPGQSGNPSGQSKKQQNYIKLFVKVVTPEMFEDLIKKTYDWAMMGHARARRDLLEFILGKPAQMIDVNLNESPAMALLQKWRDEDLAKAAAAIVAAEADVEPADDESGA